MICWVVRVVFGPGEGDRVVATIEVEGGAKVNYLSPGANEARWEIYKEREGVYVEEGSIGQSTTV